MLWITYVVMAPAQVHGGTRSQRLKVAQNLLKHILVPKFLKSKEFFLYLSYSTHLFRVWLSHFIIKMYPLQQPFWLILVTEDDG